VILCGCLQSLALVVAGASKVQRRDEKYIRAVMSILLKRHSGAPRSGEPGILGFPDVHLHI
jgi:hypothetical protein